MIEVDYFATSCDSDQRCSSGEEQGMNKSPAFQFYPKDILTDEDVIYMTNQEFGCYVRLLCHSWLEGSIPADIKRIAKLCGEDSNRMTELWQAISTRFVESPTIPGRLVNPRQEEERKKQQEHKTQRERAGRIGAKSRWDKASKDKKTDGKRIANASQAHSGAKDLPMANDSFASAIASSSSSPMKDTLSTDSGDADASTEKPPATTTKKPPKPEPKFGPEAKELATLIYDHLKEHNALPAAKDFFVRQAVIAEQLLGKQSLNDWQACFHWALTESFHRQKMTNLRYLGDVVWPQFAKRNQQGGTSRAMSSLQEAMAEALREEEEQ